MSESWYDITPYVNSFGDLKVSKLRAVIPVSIHIDIPWYMNILAGMALADVLGLLRFYQALDEGKNAVKQELEKQGLVVESISYNVVSLRPNFWAIWMTSIDAEVNYDVVVSAPQGYMPGYMPLGQVEGVTLAFIIKAILAAAAIVAAVLIAWWVSQAQVKAEEAKIQYYTTMDDYYKLLSQLYDICRQQPSNPICRQIPPPPSGPPSGGDWTTYLGMGLGIAVAVVGGVIAYKILAPSLRKRGEKAERREASKPAREHETWGE